MARDYQRMDEVSISSRNAPDCERDGGAPVGLERVEVVGDRGLEPLTSTVFRKRRKKLRYRK
jgi:hypothetical protein